MPHAVSAALALALSRARYDHADLGPGGRDMLRIAASSPELWTAIMTDNAAAIRGALTALGEECDRFARALAADDDRALRELLAAAQVWVGDRR
jgi:prephenate dehydrogenase